MSSTALTLIPSRQDFEPVKALVLHSVSSPITKALYAKALDEFFDWRKDHGDPPFHRAAFQAYRAWLESKGLSPSTINQRLAALRKLAYEAAANGLLSAETAASITQAPGVKQQGFRAGNWLTNEQAADLLRLPDARTQRGCRDRAVLAILIGCALRRSELVGLTVADLQQREGRCVIVDLRGKHGRIRTVPVPFWVKQACDAWISKAGIEQGHIFRAIDRLGAVSAHALSTQAIRDIVKNHAEKLGLQARPHDLRRTCAKLCRRGGGELEQIQLLLGHASIQTTERYLGTRQNLADAPNDRLGLSLES